MKPTLCLRVGAALAGLAVLLGAFAAHALKEQIDGKALAVFETGVRYQMYHALALLLCAALGMCGRRTGGPAVCFVAGIALFSGSLYGLAVGGLSWLGPVTPIGGVAFLVGWIWLALCGRETDGR